MPVPLAHEDKGWRFDTEAGIEEIDDRRVGSNELSAIGLLRAYVDAQLQYAQADHDGDQVLEYAQKIVSAPGQQDGLYWQADGTGELSPLGPLVANADAYTTDYYKLGEPYHGYYFKILTGQGANPPGGKYDYVINGNMIAGFAMVAWPADWSYSGVMTFAVSHQGRVLRDRSRPGHGQARARDHRLRPGSGLGRGGGRGVGAERRPGRYSAATACPRASRSASLAIRAHFRRSSSRLSDWRAGCRGWDGTGLAGMSS